MINRERLLSTFLDLVQIDNPSGEESAIAYHVISHLQRLGLNPRTDDTGNVLAQISGSGEPIMLNGHLDSVAPCRGVKPKVADGAVYSDGTTVLGADDRAGVAIILEAIETVIEGKMATCPIDLVFTVREEVGLFGAKGLDYGQISARQGFIVDHGGPVEGIVIGAPSQNNLEITVHGKAAHAGVNPEDGINAILVAAKAITRFPVGRLDEETTANVGLIQGGTARNIVPDRVNLVAEARSHSEAKLEAQTNRMKTAFEEAAAEAGAAVDIAIQRSYGSFSVSPDAPIFQRLSAAARAMGMEIQPEKTGGGSDANIFSAHGITCLILSAGYEGEHTTKEHVSVDRLSQSAELVVRAIAQC